MEERENREALGSAHHAATAAAPSIGALKTIIRLALTDGFFVLTKSFGVGAASGIFYLGSTR